MPNRVLIIEDNPANMELMVYLLQAYGHVTLQSNDGVDGVQVAFREQPDLIICDVHLPKMDGYGVVLALKNDPLLRDIPVVAVTALAMVGDRDKLLAAGFDAYIGKPIEPETFIGQIRNLLPPGRRTAGIPRAQGHVVATVPKIAVRHARILVVDDTVINSDLICSTLTPFGYDVTTANSVQAGLALLQDADFDLILSDLHMPVEDGFSFIRAVKSDPRLAETPFMFISASYGDIGESLRGMELGAICFIHRPIEPQYLLEHVETCLNGQPIGGVHDDHPHR